MSETLLDGRYEIVKRLAMGGMGEVLLARYVGDDEIGPGLLVVKRILPPQAGEAPADNQVKMLREEARLGLRLRHGNVVETFRLEDADTKAGPLLSIELLPGKSMAQVLGQAKKNKQHLPVEVALAILRGAACGLHFAHTLKDASGRALGLVHRDVSPANIFVTFDNRVKVIDFGVAKSEDSEVKTATGILKGKLGYMSPEQTLGERRLTAQADVWSLGVYAWESLTVERLFVSPNPTQVLLQIGQKHIPPTSSLRPDVPAAVDALIGKMLARDRKDRFATCADVVKAIDALPIARAIAKADIGAFLAERYAEEAAAGIADAQACARPRRKVATPTGLVEGTSVDLSREDVAVDDGPDDGSDDGSDDGDEGNDGRRSARPSDDDDDIEPSTLVMSSSMRDQMLSALRGAPVSPEAAAPVRDDAPSDDGDAVDDDAMTVRLDAAAVAALRAKATQPPSAPVSTPAPGADDARTLLVPSPQSKPAGKAVAPPSGTYPAPPGAASSMRRPATVPGVPASAPATVPPTPGGTPALRRPSTPTGAPAPASTSGPAAFAVRPPTSPGVAAAAASTSSSSLSSSLSSSSLSFGPPVATPPAPEALPVTVTTTLPGHGAPPPLSSLQSAPTSSSSLASSSLPAAPIPSAGPAAVPAPIIATATPAVPVRAPAPAEAPQWLAVGVGTFGVLALLMGVAFSFLVKAPTERAPTGIVGYADAAGDLVIVPGSAQVPPDRQDTVVPIDVEAPVFAAHPGEASAAVDKDELKRRLLASGVWQRATLPASTRAQVPLLLPLLITLLGALALAFSLPAFLVPAHMRLAARAAALAIVVALSAWAVQSGALSWPGRAAWQQTPQLPWR